MRPRDVAKTRIQPRSILRVSPGARYNDVGYADPRTNATPRTPLNTGTDIATIYRTPNQPSPPSGDRGSTPRSDPFRARGLGGGGSTFGKHVPSYTDTSMNYLEADRDLSPLRAEYSLSPLSHDLPPARVTSPVPYTGPHSGAAHSNTFTTPSLLSSRDYNSNVLHSNLKTPDAYDPTYHHSSRDMLSNDLNKSSSSHYSDTKDYKSQYRNTANTPDTPRVRRVRDYTLRQRMSEDDVRASPKPRSHSAGDPLEGGANDRDPARARTPSAPANLNHNTTSQREQVTPTDRHNSPWGNHSALSTANRSVFSQGGSTLERDPFLSRSIMSGEYRVRDPNRTQLSSVSMRLAHENDWNRPHRDQSGLSYSQSLTQNPVTPRKVNGTTPNGAAKLLRELPNGINQSKHSLDLSKTSLNQSPLFSKDYGAFNSLVSLIFISIISLIVAALAAQLLFRLNTRTASGIYGSQSDSVLSNKSYDTTQEVTVALTTFVFMLDICCLLVCSMQFFFAAKLAKCPQGEERCFKYLNECAGTRFIAVTGFFVSLPALLLSLLLYMLMEYEATSAIIAVVMLSVGVTFTLAASLHSVYCWRTEKRKADLNIPPHEKKTPTSQSELSTLV